MTKEHLNSITSYIKEKVWRNGDVMYPQEDLELNDNVCVMLVDILTSLHNELYKEVTGEYYDYAFHWTNKIGAFDPEDHIFTEDLELINNNIKSELDYVKEFCEKWGDDSCQEKRKEDILK